MALGHKVGELDRHLGDDNNEGQRENGEEGEREGEGGEWVIWRVSHKVSELDRHLDGDDDKEEEREVSDRLSG